MNDAPTSMVRWAAGALNTVGFGAREYAEMWTNRPKRILVTELPDDYPEDFPMVGQEVRWGSHSTPYFVISPPLRDFSLWLVPVAKRRGGSVCNYIFLSSLRWGDALNPQPQTFDVTVKVQATSQEEAERLVRVQEAS